jgi:hypothetical protein
MSPNSKARPPRFHFDARDKPVLTLDIHGPCPSDEQTGLLIESPHQRTALAICRRVIATLQAKLLQTTFSVNHGSTWWNMLEDICRNIAVGPMKDRWAGRLVQTATSNGKAVDDQQKAELSVLVHMPTRLGGICRHGIMPLLV